MLKKCRIKSVLWYSSKFCSLVHACLGGRGSVFPRLHLLLILASVDLKKKSLYPPTIPLFIPLANPCQINWYAVANIDYRLSLNPFGSVSISIKFIAKKYRSNEEIQLETGLNVVHMNCLSRVVICW